LEAGPGFDSGLPWLLSGVSLSGRVGTVPATLFRPDFIFGRDLDYRTGIYYLSGGFRAHRGFQLLFSFSGLVGVAPATLFRPKFIFGPDPDYRTGLVFM